jgi:uncharacterized NAD(P)/FAD-binding protein YdhS
MRTITKAEAEQNLTAVLEEAQRLLHKRRIRALQRARFHATVEAKANGFTEELLTDLLAS